MREYMRKLVQANLFYVIFLITSFMFFTPAFAQDAIKTYSDPSLTAEAAYFKNGATVYVEVNYLVYNYTGGNKTATIDRIGQADTITITIFDDGQGPGDTANDGKYTGNFTINDVNLQDTESANISAADTTATAIITADYTLPAITIDSPAQQYYGPTIPIAVQVSDAGSGLLEAKYQFTGTNVSTSVYFLTCASIGAGAWNCTATFDTSAIPRGNYANLTIWIDATDEVGNTNTGALSEIGVYNILPIIEADFSHPATYRQKWFVTPIDTLTIVGEVVDEDGDPITADVTAKLTLSGATITNQVQTFTYTGVEKFSPDWSFSGARIGTGLVELTTTDPLGNTITWNHTIYVTNPIENVSVLLSKTQDYWNEKDKPVIKIRTTTAAGAAVYKANVTISIPNADLVVKNNTDISGNHEYEFEIPRRHKRSYRINVSAFSPLDSSEIVYNDSLSLDVEYIDIELSYDYPAYPYYPRANETIDFVGHLETSFKNQTFVREEKVVQYLIYLENNMSKKVRDWTWLTTDMWANFTFDFTPTNETAYWFMINASVPWKYHENKTEFTVKSYLRESIRVGAAANITPEELYQINFTKWPDLIEMQQNDSASVNFTIKNAGTERASGLLFEFAIPRELIRNFTYSVNALPSILEVNATANVTVDMTTKDMNVSIYELKAKISSAERATDEKTINLKVSPASGLQRFLEDYYINASENVSALTENLRVLMAEANTTGTTVAWAKLLTAQYLVNESVSAIREGDYFTAHKNWKELEALVDQVQTIYSQEKVTHEKGVRTRGTIITVVIVIAAIVLLLWYLWLPAPAYKPPATVAKSERKKKDEK